MKYTYIVGEKEILFFKENNTYIWFLISCNKIYKEKNVLCFKCKTIINDNNNFYKINKGVDSSGVKFNIYHTYHENCFPVGLKNFVKRILLVERMNK